LQIIANLFKSKAGGKMKKRTKYFVLNWMDGQRWYYKTEKEALNKYAELRKDYKKHEAEFDMACYKVLAEHNNIEQ